MVSLFFLTLYFIASNKFLVLIYDLHLQAIKLNFIDLILPYFILILRSFDLISSGLETWYFFLMSDPLILICFFNLIYICRVLFASNSILCLLTNKGWGIIARDPAKFLLAFDRVENNTYMDWKLEKPLTWRKQVGLGYWAYSALYLRLVTRWRFRHDTIFYLGLFFFFLNGILVCTIVV